jgi:WhiB family transcriptional regulator, redox-sensing transcriptional regulator
MTTALATDWTLAACRDEHPELFFPVGTEGPALAQLAEAKRVCGTCPVMGECLRWALETGQDDGVWGGTSEDERRAMRRARVGGVPEPRVGD